MDKNRESMRAERGGRAGWRAWLAGIFVAAASVALLGAIVTRYVERNILDTQGYVAIVGPLPQDPAVATALANFITDRVFNTNDAESAIRDFLPPRLDGLAKPLGDTLQKRTNQIAQDVIKSDAFSATWIAANQALQRGVVRLGESKAPEGRLADAAGSLNLGELARTVRQRLGGEARLTDQQLDQAATLRIDLQQRVDRLRTTISVVKGGAQALPFVAAGFFLAAVAVAYDRRRTVAGIGGTVLLLGLASLIAFKVWSGGVLGNITNGSYHAAATVVYEAFYSDLRLRLVLSVIFGVLLVLLAALAGPYTWARRLRHALALDRFKTIPLHQWTTGARRWTAKYQRWINLAGLAAAIIWLLTLSNLTPALLVVILSLLVGFVSLVHLIARPAPAKTAG